MGFAEAAATEIASRRNPEARFLVGWLVRTIDGRFRVKWRDGDGDLDDRDFDTEAEARAYGRSLIGSRPDIEMAFLSAALRKQSPHLTADEAMERVGVVNTSRKPWKT